MTKLSIIIPCYNCSQTLKEAVDSCYQQGLDLNDFEIVMVDDASTDETKKIMVTLSQNHHNIKCFYHDKNLGGGATRNTAVEKSESKVIFCLDSDDILPQNTLNKMLLCIDDKKSDAVAINTSIKFRGKNKEDIERIDTFGYAGEEIPFQSLLQKDGILCPLYSTFMITKEAFNKIGGYPTDHGFDTQGLAWRFLLNGLTAYTCPDTKYLHRVGFHRSYYLREYYAGKINRNWKLIFEEFLLIFSEEARKIIIDFRTDRTDESIIDIVNSIENPWAKNANELIPSKDKKTLPKEEIAIINEKTLKIASRKSPKILIKIILRKLKKDWPLVYSSALHLYIFINNLKNIITERKEKRDYYKAIEKIKENKEVVLNIQFGGLGDLLALTSLPRLLKEQYGISFFISNSSQSIIKNPDFFKLCFELNPFFCGVKDGTNSNFQLKTFATEKTFINFLTDLKAPSITKTFEDQFNLQGDGKPEIYYKPKIIPEYKDVILVDKKYISGKKFGWSYCEKSFEKECNIYMDSETKIEYVDPKKQNVFQYADMIYSCKRFVSVLSGGAALAASLPDPKPFSVILPYNAWGGSVEQFIFKKSLGKYLK